MILLGCSISYLIAFVFVVYKSQISRFTFRVNCVMPVILLGFAFAITAYNIEPIPDAGWDLVSHYKLIDQMRLAGTMRLPFGNAAYNTEPLTILLHYVVSTLPTNNFFKFIAIMIEFIILSIICRSLQQEEHIKGEALCMFFILIFSLCPIYQYISGVRTVLATAFLYGALYRDLYFKRRDPIMFILYGSALSFHTFSLVIIVLRLVFLFRKSMWKCRFLFLFWGVGIVPVMSFFVKLGDRIPFFYGFSELVKYYGELGSVSKLTSNFTKYDFFRILSILLLLLSSEIGSKYVVRNSREGIEFMSFYTILCYFSIGSLVIYHLFDRMCIVVAWGSLLAISHLFKMRGNVYHKKRILIHFLLCITNSMLFLFNLRHMMVFSNLVVK